MVSYEEATEVKTPATVRNREQPISDRIRVLI